MEIINALGKQFGFRAISRGIRTWRSGTKYHAYEQQVLAMENKKFQGMDAMYAAVYKRAHELNPPGLLYLGDLLDDQKDSLYVGFRT